MEFLTVTVIAIGLAMDAFAVSIVSGATYKQLKTHHAFRIAVFFGSFQAAMPLIGALAGLTMRNYIAAYDHWIAFALLTSVGGKMIYESFSIKKAQQGLDPSNLHVLLILSVATSIDALAVGITLSFLATGIFTAVIIIGLITFILSYFGVYIGKRFGHFFENKIEAIGGIILIAIAIKILLSHLLA
jgi:putative Mn2+ efflux pump MntP